MNEYEIARLAVARDGLDVAAGNMLAAIIAAVGIWVFGIGMLVQNWLRAKAEQLRAEAEQRRHEETMTALTELIRRTSPPRPRRIARQERDRA